MGRGPDRKPRTRRPVASLLDRYIAKVDRRAPDECWPWLGAVSGDGYGQIQEGGRTSPLLYAHRFGYEVARGAIPAGLTIDHLCRNRRCQNPAHMEAVSRAENGRRAALARWTPDTVPSAVPPASPAPHAHDCAPACTDVQSWPYA